MVTWDEGRGNGELFFNGNRVYIGDDDKLLRINSDDSVEHCECT